MTQPHLFGLTKQYSTVYQSSGNIDIKQIQPEDVIDIMDPNHEKIDFRKVFAFINTEGSQSIYSSVLIFEDSRVVKTTLSPNQLLVKMSDQFPIHLVHDMKYSALELDISRLIPYGCGDYWWIPVGQKANNNHSWVRVLSKNEQWVYEKRTAFVSYPGLVTLKLPHSRKAIYLRKRSCHILMRYYYSVGNTITPTLIEEQELSEDEVMRIGKGKTKRFRESLLRKLMRDA
ncbi:hypothetical protein [Secundilactobacillus folii]|uniref:ComK family protein n=1 Tax=Secundilactobacillus folii TaxID=2678357 RepID=A0A7X3C1X3_9LACO|nr:hypothetical protein [Secundilactobacillus folii]MTV82215.1 hypothetical protein [Secundilactobacillus folii]